LDLGVRTWARNLSNASIGLLERDAGDIFGDLGWRLDDAAKARLLEIEPVDHPSVLLVPAARSDPSVRRDFDDHFDVPRSAPLGVAARSRRAHQIADLRDVSGPPRVVALLRASVGDQLSD